MATDQSEDWGQGPRDTAPSAPLGSSVAQIHEVLRSRIVTFDLPPGARLSRSDLAERFGVSASPLREAIQLLELEGLVATFRQSRTVVTHIDPGLLRQEQFLRAGIECEVVNALAAMPDKQGLRKASAILRMQKVLIEEPDQIDLFRKLDDDFHAELFHAAGRSALHDLLRQMTSQMARLRMLDLPSEGKLASIVALHEEILAAILAGDRHAAADAMRRHLSGTIARLPAIMAQYPDYFLRDPQAR